MGPGGLLKSGVTNAWTMFLVINMILGGLKTVERWRLIVKWGKVKLETNEEVINLGLLGGSMKCESDGPEIEVKVVLKWFLQD